jgi:NADH:ubiquinone oxidoreductase subunit 2 (subunit N)
MIPFLYMLGIVPFHMLCEEKTAKAILPVSHYFILIMPLAVWGVFFKLNVVLFSTFANQLQMVYLVLSVLSMVFGALGVNSRMNLHRKYALAAIFHFGVILVLLSFFTHRTDFMAFIYLVAYILSMNGIYMTFYSLKSRGEYLSLEEDLSGVAKTQELTTGALLLSLFSLMGTPFLIGFTSEFNIVYELFSLKKYSLIGIMCVLMLFVAKGYLGIIKTAYFEPKIKAYDRENAMVLFYAGVSMLSIIVLSFNPYSVWQKMEDMFYVLYL